MTDVSSRMLETEVKQDTTFQMFWFEGKTDAASAWRHLDRYQSHPAPANRHSFLYAEVEGQYFGSWNNRIAPGTDLGDGFLVRVYLLACIIERPDGISIKGNMGMCRGVDLSYAPITIGRGPIFKRDSAVMRERCGMEKPNRSRWPGSECMRVTVSPAIGPKYLHQFIGKPAGNRLAGRDACIHSTFQGRRRRLNLPRQMDGFSAC